MGKSLIVMAQKQRNKRSRTNKSDMVAAHLLDHLVAQAQDIELRHSPPFRAPTKVLTSLQQCEHCNADIALLIFGDNASDAGGLEAYARLMAEPIRKTNLPAFVIAPPSDPRSTENPSLLLKVHPIQEEPFLTTPDEWLALIRALSDAHCPKSSIWRP
ncbi:hypothetical protein [Propionivibrio sp.]|uniref:hypothetical protein n=1 Tax=Propionivibrio sp. TaxID=2212460 RepID=UPI003BF2AF1E